MKFKSVLKSIPGIAASARILSAAASNLFYRSDVDTTALAGHPNGLFTLDFQLTDGDGLHNGSASNSSAHIY